MKAPETTFDLKLQAEILQLGRLLAFQNEAPKRSGKRSACPSPDALTAEVERVLALLRASPVRRQFGIRNGFVGVDDTLRLKAVALLAWRMVGEGISHNPVTEIVAAVVDANRGSYCEQFLLTKDCLGRMVCEGLLTVTFDQGNEIDGRLLLPNRIYTWLCGGQESKGDFCAGKIASARLGRTTPAQTDKPPQMAPLRVPTARQIYDAVRREVVGLDPQVKVLASRIALHVARAELLRSGKQEHAVGNAVVLLAGVSGSGKSFLAERTAAAAALPFAQIDSTTLTASGFVGSDVDEIYKLLVNAAGGDVPAASRGLVFLDEFCKKSSRYARGGLDSRDVGGEAVQMELLSKLQATTTPFVVGGKRSTDGCRPFLFDGRPTGYILAGVFAGLDEEIERQAGRKGIGFASEAGSRKHVRIADCLKELGFLEELVNRIGLVLRLPDPTVENVMRTAAGGILDGFNAVLAPREVILMPTAEAVRAIGDYSMESRAFYRGAKAIFASIAAEVLFDPRKGSVTIEANDVKRAIERLSSGMFQTENQCLVNEAAAVLDFDLDAQPETALTDG